ncbi:probable receptor-like protein kinase isoform X1 [Tanacetum coccineum]|uniref:Probable receptor-like protein kinase isoform X1 n=1 Tax=Tanacetum coccineum TaxID=301880 RepID=A0ABQ5D3J1_9ASTR
MDKGNGDAEKLTSSTSAQPSRRFTIAEIQSATNNFDDELVIGQGGFGKVYKGQISIEESSHFVAIKRLDSMSNQGAAEFKAEIEMLSNLRHCNLVSLIGYCDDNREMILVYVYMPRLKIAIGAGRGLDYLHTGFGTQHGVIHRDVKSSNILLDENLAAMISDFGKLTRKTDVYAFGVVLFELLSGKLAVDRDIEEEQGTIAPKCLRGFAEIENRCLIRDFEKRPSMTQVVAKLQDLLELQEKCDNSADSPGMTSGVNWMIRQYRGSATNQNSDHVGTSRSSGANMNHCNQLSTIGDADGLQEMPHQWTTVPTEDLKEFTYDELKYAARGFGYETCLAEWRYGKIYKGWLNEMTYSPSVLDNGLAISIKIFQRDHKKFLDNSELELVLTYLRHPNIVKLIGYCLEGDVLFLVYEFMHNGNFEDCLLADFTAKFWNYNVWKFRTWNDEKIDSYYHSGCRNSIQISIWDGSNLASFTLVLAEILIGEPVPGSNAYKNLSLQDFGKHMEILKEWKSLGSLAKLCFRICNDVDSELKKLRFPCSLDFWIVISFSKRSQSHGLRKHVACEFIKMFDTFSASHFSFKSYPLLVVACGELGSVESCYLELVLTYLRHPNIVKLIGYCLEGDVLFLVYEFMHNGNFEDCLHSGAVARLPLDTRVKMALGIARGLVFLHSTQDKSASDWSWIQKTCVFERCNILLNADFTAKFWNYNVWKFRTWNDEKIDSYYHSGCRRPKSLYGRSNLASFTLVLAEILIGEPVPGSNAYKNLSLQDFGKHMEILKEWKSLGSLAKLCFRICNDVDSELKMLRALKKLYPSMMEALVIATTDSFQN